MCVRHGVDVIYHASYIDDEGELVNRRSRYRQADKHEPGMDMLAKKKHKHIVAPGINWIIATLEDACAFGYPQVSPKLEDSNLSVSYHRSYVGSISTEI